MLSIMTVVACTAGRITVDVSLCVTQGREEHAMGHDPGVTYTPLSMGKLFGICETLRINLSQASAPFWASEAWKLG